MYNITQSICVKYAVEPLSTPLRKAIVCFLNVKLMVKKFEFSLLIRITVRYTVIIRRFICFLRKILLNSENIVDDGKYQVHSDRVRKDVGYEIFNYA
ncbi:hypothetical protein B8A42_02035 [Dolosigranulum pigrum]|nr:hypothetical protein B8A42_02035 [Dolosigranulum pigrum]